MSSGAKSQAELRVAFENALRGSAMAFAQENPDITGPSMLAVVVSFAVRAGRANGSLDGFLALARAVWVEACSQPETKSEDDEGSA